MLRCGCRGLILLLNNGGYTIEAMIHDGPYNPVQPWRYASLVEAFGGGEGRAWGRVVRTEAELLDALEAAQGFEGLAFIEVMLEPRDCHPSLVTWGAALARYNAQPGP